MILLPQNRFLALMVAAGAFLLLLNITVHPQTKEFAVSIPKVDRFWNPIFEGKPEREFEALEHKLSDATRLADKPVLENLLADDLMILGVSYSKKHWIEVVISGKGTFANYEKRIDRIKSYGDVVVITGLQIVDSVAQSRSTSYQFNFMSTWLKTKQGRWQCVAIAGDQVKSRV